MKTLKNYLFIFTLLLATISCDSLLGDEEQDFSCDKNATVTLNGNEHCAFARAETKAGRLQIGFGYATGGVDLLINTKDLKENVTYTYAKGEVAVWFNNLNKIESGLFAITKLDTENRVMSGHFDFKAESNNNSQASEYIVGARFTAVPY
ncbi:DUF6252 family protein [uncultured Polaribacter sp.]|uniref:DUF6252 family protein n=1 Tax=uncultured Polaribacter sp. TaxID=174711 RepID=UPI002630382C|nr:DUF6252 family protein [uncultured Polaribacter sp.]